MTGYRVCTNLSCTGPALLASTSCGNGRDQVRMEVYPRQQLYRNTDVNWSLEHEYKSGKKSRCPPKLGRCHALEGCWLHFNRFDYVGFMLVEKVLCFKLASFAGASLC